MGGKGSGIYQKRYKVAGLGEIRLITIAKLLNQGVIDVVIGDTLKEKLRDYDGFKIDDNGKFITIKVFKTIRLFNDATKRI